MQILAHTKVSTPRYLMHTAKVRVDEPIMTDFKPDVEVLAFNAAIKVGYPPAGFDLWNPTATEIAECVYELKWESATNCN